MNKAKFEVDKDKCTACGLCVKVCPGAVLRLEGGAPRIADFEVLFSLPFIRFSRRCSLIPCSVF